MAKMPGQGSKASMATAAAAAIAMLQDPKVREQLVEASSAAAEGIRSWKARRAERDALRPVEPKGIESSEGMPRDRRPMSKKLTAKVGNQKLEKRVENLEANIELLRATAGPEASRALEEVEDVTNRLSVAVAMAANLPLTKRVKAHREIGSVLDELETALFSQALG